MSQCVVVQRPCTEWDYGLNCIHVPHSFHIFSLCPLTYLTLINCLHLCLSLATVLADARLFQPSFVRSCSVVLLHVGFWSVYFLRSFWVPYQRICTYPGDIHSQIMANPSQFPVCHIVPDFCCFYSAEEIFIRYLLWPCSCSLSENTLVCAFTELPIATVIKSVMDLLPGI